LLCKGFSDRSGIGQRDRQVSSDFERSGPFIGVGGLAVAAFLYGYSAIALPSLLHSVVLPLLWLAFLVVASVFFTRRPRLVMLLPLLAVATWFAVLLAPAAVR
jgi:hypothetical protein